MSCHGVAEAQATVLENLELGDGRCAIRLPTQTKEGIAGQMIQAAPLLLTRWISVYAQAFTNPDCHSPQRRSPGPTPDIAQ
nr:hypothetical protein [uncultured bacterium]